MPESLDPLDSLFAAGTISLTTFDSRYITQHDGWRLISLGDFLSMTLLAKDQGLAENVHTLLHYGWIKVSALQPPEGDTCFRIYVVPRDAPGQATSLRALNDLARNKCEAALCDVISHINSSSRAWLEGSDGDQASFLHEYKVDRTLSEIFSALPSPVLDEAKINNDACREKLSLVMSDSTPGLRSTLYSYQKETVARLLQQELCPGFAPNPTFIPVTSSLTTGNTFYINPTNFFLRLEPEMFFQERGGILAEELGLGKTVITLSLILCTRDDLPSPPLDSSFLTPSVYTSVAYERFGSFGLPEEREMIQKTFPLRNPISSSIPSLRDYALHRLRTSNLPFPPMTDNIPDHLRDLINENVPFYHLQRTTFIKSLRNQPEPTVSRIYLSTATLIVVPVMLGQQWMSEIYKHVLDGYLRVLVINSRADIPPVELLATKYDIVLMTDASFAVAMKVMSICKCHKKTGICGPVLSHIHWKRLIVDEGNICGNNTDIVEKLARLNVERRWIVTGTPTTNLVGGNVGMRIEPSDLLPLEDVSGPRPWKAGDRSDLNKLASMIGEFLCIPPFFRTEDGSSGIATFRSEVTSPVCHADGPLAGSIQVLSAVMAQVIIRHRVEDIIRDVRLAEYTHETVLLDLDEYAAKTYNVMQTSIIVNAVDSERVGPDYLFSPQNTTYLQNLSQNISQSLFWRFDDEVLDIDEMTKRTTEALERAIQREASQEDIHLLRRSVELQQIAANDTTWRSMLQQDEVPFRVLRLPSSLEELRISSNQIVSDSGFIDSFMRPSRVMRLREVYRECPTNLSNPEFIKALDEHGRQPPKATPPKKKARNTGSQTSRKAKSKLTSTFGSAIADEQRVERTTRRRETTLVEINNELNARSSVVELENKSLVSISSQLHGTQVGCSGSSKLDYILSEVSKYSTEEKFIIFSALPLSLAYVWEGLKLIGVGALQFGHGTSRKEREQVVVTFKTSDEIRVLLMELKDGARGLNITEASRIIFCEPVWALDVEAQAIKRAHRIGQRRSITVKTLAIRSTVEEEIMAKRSKQATSRDICVDDGMRHFIKNPKFIGHRSPSHDTAFTIPFIPGLTISEPAGDVHSHEDIVHIDEDPAPLKRSVRFGLPDEDSSPPKKKRLTIRFADD